MFIKNVLRIAVICVTVLSPLYVIAQKTERTTEDISYGNIKAAEAELDEEIRWLQEEAAVMTEIATRTKMDADLVPGMVTILFGEDLEARGVRTVYEALTLVPGVNTYLSSLGEQRVSVRGVGGSFFSGNLKLLLDDIVLNDTLTSAGYAVYEIPVEQVERIEIIRGPGSVVYGEFAYAGVINVKTRKDRNRIFSHCKGEEDSLYQYGGGGTYSYSDPERAFSISLNLSASESDGPDVRTGKDRLYAGFAGFQMGDYSNAPGPLNNDQEDRLASLLLNYKGFSLSAQYIQTGRGDYFGIVQALPPPDRVVIHHEHRAVEAHQRLNLSDAFEMNVKAGGRQYEYETDPIVGVPPILGIQIPLEDGTFTEIDITPPDGSLAALHHEETEIYGISELIWKTGYRHTVLLGMKYSDIKMGDVWVYSNTSDENPGVWEREAGNWLKDDRQRDVISLYMQDMFDITDRFTLTAGLRYDHYENHDTEAGTYDSLTPRLSAVYRLTDHHILKAQYSEAVRPPTFTELYSQENSVVMGNPKLEPEHIRSYETGYIYRRSKTRGRITMFYSELEDNIEYPEYADPMGDGGEIVQYRNADDTITTKGIELEFSHDLRPDIRLDMNLSFADTQDEEGEPICGATDWLGNIGLRYHPLDDFSLAFQYRYVGERHRNSDDDRDELDAYDTLDITANISDLFTKGLTLRCGVKNLFDETILYPAPVYKDEAGNIGYTYPDDFPRPGQSWWAQMAYDF